MFWLVGLLNTKSGSFWLNIFYNFFVLNWWDGCFSHTLYAFDRCFELLLLRSDSLFSFFLKFKFNLISIILEWRAFLLALISEHVHEDPIDPSNSYFIFLFPGLLTCKLFLLLLFLVCSCLLSPSSLWKILDFDLETLSNSSYSNSDFLYLLSSLSDLILWLSKIPK